MSAILSEEVSWKQKVEDSLQEVRKDTISRNPTQEMGGSSGGVNIWASAWIRLCLGAGLNHIHS